MRTSQGRTSAFALVVVMSFIIGDFSIRQLLIANPTNEVATGVRAMHLVARAEGGQTPISPELVPTPALTKKTLTRPPNNWSSEGVNSPDEIPQLQMQQVQLVQSTLGTQPVNWRAVARGDSNVRTAAIEPHEAQRNEYDLILQTLGAWRKAWQDQLVDAYIAHYIADFRPHSGTSHDAWLRDRQSQLKRPKKITVGIANVQLRQLGRQRWMAIFKQRYQSNTYQDEVTKLLIFTKVKGQYLIAAEHPL